MYCEVCGMSCNCEPEQIYLPFEMSLALAKEHINNVLAYEDRKRKRTQYGCHDHRVLKEMNRRESDKYIEAINGGRTMRWEYDAWWKLNGN